MDKFYHRFFQLTITWMLGQSLFFVISTAGFVSSTTLFSSKVEAQSPPPSVSNSELDKYAKAVLAMESGRQQAFDEIKKILGTGDIPKIICNEPSSLNGLPAKAKDIAVNYCSRSQKIVEDNGLTIQRFNDITKQLQNDESIKKQMYNTLLRLQKQPNP